MTKENDHNEVQDSLSNLADNLVVRTNELLSKIESEEDLRIGFEKLIEPIKNRLSIKSEPSYEKSIKSIFKGRSDAVHGQVIIEYENPSSFYSKSNVDHAYKQLIDYLTGESKYSDINKLVGVGFDGQQIFFVKYKGKENEIINETKFTIQGPYEFTQESAMTLLIHLRALAKLPLTAENLSKKFGPQSEITKKAVLAFYNALKNWGNQTRIQTFYNEWKRLFGIVYGEQFNRKNEKGVDVLSKIYKTGRDINFQDILFSIHTYFAFLMKIIALEIVTLKETYLTSSYSYELANIPEEELKRELEDIENGGPYARKGITNFLEGDFFKWYIDALESPQLKDSIREIARELSEFEPATSTLNPTATRDLIKKLYQYLVNKDIRKQLGEFYTPDWLAELLLNEVGYNGNTSKRFLDPACGSGTFLVLAIQRAKEQGQKEGLPAIEIAKRIVDNIWGFDLNPLAVIASRTNYLFALGDLAGELRSLEIPVYLADSVLWPEHIGVQGELNFHGEHVKIKTSVGEFHVPSIWIKDKGFLMKEASELIEIFVKNNYEPEIAMKHFKEKGLVFPPYEDEVENFYKEILELEDQNKDGIWARFLKNAFAPMVAGKFDFVVGNPPWIRLQYISKEYREATKHLWKNYGLFSLKGYKTILGGGEKDFSMLFTYAASDYYLKDNGKLGFLITREVFKSKGAGEGFRRFQLGDKEYLKVLKAHDFVQLNPFDDPKNKAAAIIIKKAEQTKYPINYLLWKRKERKKKIPYDSTLKEALLLLNKRKLLAKPIDSITSSWQTISENIEEFENISEHIKGKNIYKAYQGVDPQPYGVFLIEIRQLLSNSNAIINNLAKNKRKIEVPQSEDTIESELVFPAISGKDFKRWYVNRNFYIILVQDPNTRKPYPENIMKSKWPRTYNYVLRFKKYILSCVSKPIRRLREQTNFYAMYGVGNYTMKRYKVIWKIGSNDIISVVISHIKTPMGYKLLIPIKTVIFFSTDYESEAHYLCAIVNSNPVRDFIKSFSSAGRGFGTPSVMEHVGIPKFDQKNEIHQKLSEISKKCHKLKLEGKEKDIEDLERENDELVKILFKIK